MTYKECMAKFGSDKPDLRIPNEIQDVYYADDAKFSKALWFQKSQINQQISKSAMKKFVKEVKELFSNHKLTIIEHEISEHSGKILEKVLPTDTDLKGQIGDLGFIVQGGQEIIVQECLGKIRTFFSEKYLDLDPEVLKFLWVVDFPLFLPNPENGKLEAAHHPFTRPVDEDLKILKSNPEKVRAQHYDLVLNGQEIGGGSMRIHESDLQEFILKDILCEDTKELCHMLEALRYGCPPHGGIALGLDRIMMIIRKAKSIRDVIAFPKTANGKDLMSGAPSLIRQEEKDYYHLK